MFVYSIMLISSLFIAFCLNKGKVYLSYKEYKINLGIFLSFFPFWLVTCLRYEVGTDYTTYIKFYAESVPKGLYNTDYLFSLIIKICVNIFHNPYLIIIVLGTIFVFLMFRFICLYSENIYFSIFLFFFTGTFPLSLNIMKQMVATAIWLNSIQYIKNKKIGHYSIMLFLAVGFHKVALIYAFMYFLYNRKIAIKKSFPIVLFGIYLLKKQIRAMIIIITEKFSFYYGYFYNTFDRRTGSLVLLVINIYIMFLMVFVMRKENNKNTQNIFYFNTQFICLLLTVLMEILPNAERIVYLFLPMQIVSVPAVIKNISKRYRKLIICTTIVLYVGLFVKLFIINNIGQIFPYKFISLDLFRLS